MSKAPIIPPQDPLKRLPDWYESLLEQHFKGLTGLFVRQLLYKSSVAERSEKAKSNAAKRHAGRNKIKESARSYYLSNRDNYDGNKAAAADLSIRFGEFEFRTYENWVSKWSSE
jgi:hypothetical protein